MCWAGNNSSHSLTNSVNLRFYENAKFTEVHDDYETRYLFHCPILVMM